jgi:hypothetical protein
MRRPGPNAGKANACGEATGASTHGGSRSRGPDTRGRIGRDNVGKGLCPAVADSKLQRPAARGDAEAGRRATGLAHEPV